MSENQTTENESFHSQQALLGQLLGGQNGDPQAIMQRVQRMSKLFNNSSSTPQNADAMPTKTRQGKGIEHILHAALPYLDTPYQKHMFMMSKLFEMQRVIGQREEDVIMETREKAENPAERRMEMLKAIQPFLQDGEREQLNQMMRMVQMREIFSAKEDVE